MTVDEVHAYFDHNWANVCRELKLGVNTYQGWIKRGYIPMATQLKIEKQTQGKLQSELTKQQQGK
jgi:hypothetical protein